MWDQSAGQMWSHMPGLHPELPLLGQCCQTGFHAAELGSIPLPSAPCYWTGPHSTSILSAPLLDRALCCLWWALCCQIGLHAVFTWLHAASAEAHTARMTPALPSASPCTLRLDHWPPPMAPMCPYWAPCCLCPALYTWIRSCATSALSHAPSVAYRGLLSSFQGSPQVHKFGSRRLAANATTLLLPVFGSMWNLMVPWARCGLQAGV